MTSYTELNDQNFFGIVPSVRINIFLIIFFPIAGFNSPIFDCFLDKVVSSSIAIRSGRSMLDEFVVS